MLSALRALAPTTAAPTIGLPQTRLRLGLVHDAT